jgi:diguanylate cyclase (GGDEF)-like protein/PAS domain S-box-containing protein
MDMQSADIQLFKDSLIDSLFEGAYFVDLEKQITFWNKAAERISGYTRDEVMSRRCSDNLLRHIDESGRQLCLEGCPLSATLADGMPRQADVFLHHQDGHRVPVQIRVSPVRNAEGEIVGAVELFTEKRSRQRMLQEMERLKKEIFKDELTQIANRKYALLQIRRHLQELKSLRIQLGVLMIDIDHFKGINDHYGHNTGDRALVMVAKSIENCVRELDTSARWGGEEFLVIMPHVSPDELRKVAERIRLQIENSWLELAQKKILRLTASIGGVLAAVGDEPEGVIERADQKMYAAKREGRNRVLI